MLDERIEWIYNMQEGNKELQSYHDRHGTPSLCILTVYDQKTASAIASKLEPKIRGKIVVEVGAGVGLLAMELANYASHVYAIEADPAWSWAFVEELYIRKPTNLTWIFGMAEDVADWLHADVAIFCTRSGEESMRLVCSEIAPEVINATKDPGNYGRPEERP